MTSTCTPRHDWFTSVLTGGLCIGLVVSYIPQHFRIINKGSSEGFSPWFLLLGSTSCAAGLLNMVTLQWGIIKCCRIFTFGTCAEMVAGVVQVGLQWALFTLIFILFMIYYPPHLKYVTTTNEIDDHDSREPTEPKNKIRSEDWHLSIILAWTVVAHLFLITFTTFFILFNTSSASPRPQHLLWWAGFLGISSAILAAVQYLPQILRTYRAKHVGALSIPMMMMQTPGAIGMVLSIALRPGTNWTSWITFAVAGIMQGTLLTMCIIWKFRQRRLGIDDFGNPLEGLEPSGQSIPVLQITGPDEHAAPIVERALDSAVEEDVRSGVVIVRNEPDADGIGEETPLLGKSIDGDSKGGSWFGWMRRRR